MKIVAGHLRLSATDLANHAACRHLSTLDYAMAEGSVAPPERAMWLPESMQLRGEAHERAYADHLRAAGLRIVDLRELLASRGPLRGTGHWRRVSIGNQDKYQGGYGSFTPSSAAERAYAVLWDRRGAVRLTMGRGQLALLTT